MTSLQGTEKKCSPDSFISTCFEFC